MTRNDIRIAAAVKAARPCQPKPTGIGRSEYEAATSALDAVTLNLCEALTAANPKFNAARFIDACGGA